MRRFLTALFVAALCLTANPPVQALTEAPRGLSAGSEDRQDSLGRRPQPKPPKPKRLIPSDPEKRCPQHEAKFRAYGLVPVDTFSYIAWRESRCRIKAINARFDSRGRVVWTLNKNGTIDRGLLQVNSRWMTVTSRICGTPYGQLDILLTVDCNLRVAKYLFDNGGLGHWGY